MKKKAKKLKKETRKPRAEKPTRDLSIQPIVQYSELLQPEMHKGKYTLIPTAFTHEQIVNIIAPTPRNIIKTRPGKGGGQWDYVPGWWFKKKLNYVFGFNWDFNILGERVDGNFITVKGQLIVKHPKTGDVLASKTDFGGAEIKFKRGTKEFLDMGNDFKAAATDALKRCAVQVGIAMDVYGASEAKSEGFQVVDDAPKPQPPTSNPPVVVPAVVDYKANLNVYLEAKGYKSDEEKLKIIGEKLNLFPKSYQDIMPALAQSILLRFRKLGADEHGKTR